MEGLRFWFPMELYFQKKNKKPHSTHFFIGYTEMIELMGEVTQLISFELEDYISKYNIRKNNEEREILLEEFQELDNSEEKIDALFLIMQKEFSALREGQTLIRGELEYYITNLDQILKKIDNTEEYLHDK